MEHNDNSKHDRVPDSTPQAHVKGRAKQLIISLGALLILLILGLAVWKHKSDSAEEKLTETLGRIEELEKSRAADVEAASTRLREALDARTEAFMRLSAIPLTWAIRADYLSGNLQRIEAYINEFSRERLVAAVLLADANDTIILASDKGLEKQKFESVYPAEYLKFDSPTVQRTERGSVRMILPIMGMSARAGTLVVTYNAAPGNGAEK